LCGKSPAHFNDFFSDENTDILEPVKKYRNKKRSDIEKEECAFAKTDASKHNLSEALQF